MDSYEGSSAITDGDGHLLFYSDGQNLWDNTHQFTNNGRNLKGNVVGTQNSIFLPRPDTIGQYYLITNDAEYLMGFAGGLYYSIIDQSLNGGKGDIIPNKKNIKIADTLLEKFAVTRHANGKDYWVVTHKANSDTLCSYLITSKGISTIPVKSKTGYPLKVGDGRGQLKISPDGNKIAFTGRFTVVGSFNAANGKVSNIWKTADGTYGLDFSQNGNFLYLLNLNNLLQFSVNEKSSTDFINSKIEVDSLGYYSAVQLGPDGKIYFSRNKFLSVIHAPDSAGKSCRVRHNYIDLKGDPQIGLPSFLSTFMLKNKIKFTRNCFNDSTLFKASIRSDFDSLKWNFGDSTSGKANYSTVGNTTYNIFKKIANYKVELVIYYKSMNDTVRIEVPIKFVKPFIGNDTIYCNKFTADIYSKRHYLKYQWNTGSQSEFLLVDKAGTYILTAMDSLLCFVSDTIEIKNPIAKADFILSDSALCIKGNRFHLKTNSSFTDNKPFLSQWTFSDGTISSDSVLTKIFKIHGKYAIKLFVKSSLGCTDSLIKTVSVYQNSQIGFTINKAHQCDNNQSFDFINTTTNKDSLAYQWDLGDLNSTLKDFFGKKYKAVGRYEISLYTTSINNCRDTLSQIINVLPSPLADFSFGRACNKSLTAFNFSGKVPDTSVSTNFLWNFGGSDSSHLMNPSKVLKNTGINKVFLKLTSSNNCTDTITKEVEVLVQAKADFNVEDVCEDNYSQFFNVSNDATAYNWKFGDGTNSNLESPRHLYNNRGKSTTYNVTLVGIVKNGCSDSITKATTVNSKPNSDFIFKSVNGSIEFTAKSTNNTSYFWKFGNTDSIVSSNYVYTHKLIIPEQSNVCLITTNAAGCSSKTCHLITLDISKFERKDGIKIYPNPNSGHFNIEIEQPKNRISIEVVNVFGALLYRLESSDFKSKFTLDLDASNGICFIKITNGGSITLHKMVLTNK